MSMSRLLPKLLRCPLARRRTVAMMLFTALLAVQAPLAAFNDRGGQLIDVGGHRLNLYCIGEGGPAVVLDAGLGGWSGDWWRIQRALAEFREVCVYDRAGYGQSEPGPAPRTSTRIAAELRTLLARGGVPPPYVLAGHSFGGFNMRVFAALFPEDVAGLVMVDPPHESQVNGVLEGTLLRSLDPGGFLGDIWRPETLAGLAGQLEPLARMLGLSVPGFRAVTQELMAFRLSAEETQAAVLAPDLPLVVIAHGQRVLPAGPLGDRLEQEWLGLLRRQACDHPLGRYWVAEDSGHFVMYRQPELIVEAIRQVTEPPPAAEIESQRRAVCGS